MADGGPYRSDALAVAQTHVEVVRCGWCAWRKIPQLQTDCSGPPSGHGEPRQLNANGDCPYYRDSFATRLLRRFGLRRPALMRVSDRDKPDNPPKSRTPGWADIYQGSLSVDPHAVRPPASPSAVTPAPKPVSGRRTEM